MVEADAPVIRILVVDDNAISRELIRAAFDDDGFAVDEAADGSEALARMRETVPNVVLMDIQMPVMDGYTALREIRRNPGWQHVPVVALTAYAMLEDRERAFAAGFNGYLAKPVNLTALRLQIEQLLKHRPT